MAPLADTHARTQKPGKGTYAFVSLGCPKNVVDSERMLGLLQLDGYELVDEPSGTDFVVVNTCGFIEQARQESFSTIDDMLELKRAGATRGVIVAGCLAERQQEQLLASRPEIDGLLGVFSREAITSVADRLLGNAAEQRLVFRPAPIRAASDRDRLRITPRHLAYLKISEGCDRLCTFCSIPSMRGKHASKPLEEVVSEARQLAADGVRELIVVAQDTSYYGIDLYGEPRLEKLITRLNELDVDWIRLMYLYPQHVSNALIERIASSEKVVPYIDLPLQHISDPVLRRMARRVNRRETEELLHRLREGIEDLTLRTTFITGFPGETDQDFAELVDFVREQQFERLGVFAYSFEPNTPSARLDGHLSEDVKQQRRDHLMTVQQQLAFAWNQRQIGRVRDVILDQPVPDESNVWMGRTSSDAPDVDGMVFVTENGTESLSPGTIVPVEIVAVQNYDLIGVAMP